MLVQQIQRSDQHSQHEIVGTVNDSNVLHMQAGGTQEQRVSAEKWRKWRQQTTTAQGNQERSEWLQLSQDRSCVAQQAQEQRAPGRSEWKGEVLIDSGADYGVVPARAVAKKDYTGERVWANGAREGLKDVASASFVIGGKTFRRKAMVDKERFHHPEFWFPLDLGNSEEVLHIHALFNGSSNTPAITSVNVVTTRRQACQEAAVDSKHPDKEVIVKPLTMEKNPSNNKKIRVTSKKQESQKNPVTASNGITKTTSTKKLKVVQQPRSNKEKEEETSSEVVTASVATLLEVIDSKDGSSNAERNTIGSNAEQTEATAAATVAGREQPGEVLSGQPSDVSEGGVVAEVVCDSGANNNDKENSEAAESSEK